MYIHHSSTSSLSDAVELALRSSNLCMPPETSDGAKAATIEGNKAAPRPDATKSNVREILKFMSKAVEDHMKLAR